MIIVIHLTLGLSFTVYTVQAPSILHGSKNIIKGGDLNFHTITKQSKAIVDKPQVQNIGEKFQFLKF